MHATRWLLHRRHDRRGAGLMQVASVQMRRVKAAWRCLPRSIGRALLRSLQESRIRAAAKIIHDHRHLIGNDKSVAGEDRTTGSR
jgi:hypothetical protein